MNIELPKNTPWPSTYESLGEAKPEKLRSRYGREAAAFRSAIPALTTEPPQIHLIAERDGKPFEELITEFSLPFHVAMLNARTGQTILKKYNPGEDIIMPDFTVHWLINPNNQRLEFKCEYAPHPWDGQGDEPEFENLSSLWKEVSARGLMQKVLEASRD